MQDVVGVQFLKGGCVHYYRAPQETAFPLHTVVVVESDHGLQLARVVRGCCRLNEKQSGANLRSIVRAATLRDQEQQHRNELKEQEAYRLCRQKVQDKDLKMKLVDVTYTLDGRKAVFFFTAENRVDFRELVKELAQALRLKIEMRQIGVRDEARRLGGVGGCGRQLCCSSFLRDFSSVSIRMAKEQNLSLNPTKVSGLCGRLMCCLAYEYEGTLTRGKRKPAEEAAPAPAGAPTPAPAQAGAPVQPGEPQAAGQGKPAGGFRRSRRRRHGHGPKPATPQA